MIENFTQEELYMQLCKHVYNDMFQFSVCRNLVFDYEKEDISALTVQEILEKIKAFLAQTPKEVNKSIFLEYLAHFPVSMCKREVSPLLRAIIGFHYRLGEPNNEQLENGAEKTSYDDLAQIFVRSKATISDCVNKTKVQWDSFKQDMDREIAIEAEAKRQLIEERKELLKTNGETKE